MRRSPEAVLLNMYLLAPCGCEVGPLCAAQILSGLLQLGQAGCGRQPQEMVDHIEACSSRTAVLKERCHCRRSCAMIQGLPRCQTCFCVPLKMATGREHLLRSLHCAAMSEI